MCACMSAQLFVVLHDLNVLCIDRQFRALVSQVVRVNVLMLS